MSTPTFTVAALLLVLSVATLQGQPTTQQSPHALALAGSITARTDVESADGNPALLSDSEHRASIFGSLGVPTDLPLLDGGASVSFPIMRVGTIGLNVEGSSVSTYRALTTTLLAARHFGTIRFGIGLTIANVAVTSYRPHYLPGLTIGSMLPVSSDLDVAFAFAHLAAADLTGTPPKQTLRGGLCYRPDSATRLSLDLVSASKVGAGLSIGFDRDFLPALRLRAGIGVSPVRVGTGFRLQVGSAIVTYGAAYREQIGISQAIGGAFRW